MEGELLQGMLASEGIEAHLVGRDLVGATGELPIYGPVSYTHLTLPTILLV